jgi:hypothetical protein
MTIRQSAANDLNVILTSSVINLFLFIMIIVLKAQTDIRAESTKA